jgi:hypothetical protein
MAAAAGDGARGRGVSGGGEFPVTAEINGYSYTVMKAADIYDIDGTARSTRCGWRTTAR